MSDRLSRLFAALADPTRRDLVARLASADATVGELAQAYEVSMQAVSKHLKVLESAGLITKIKDSQRRMVHLEVDQFDHVSDWLVRYRSEAEQRFSRLDAVLAEWNDSPSPQGPPPPTKPLRRNGKS